jgi:hypothetical protein
MEKGIRRVEGNPAALPPSLHLRMKMKGRPCVSSGLIKFALIFLTL